jgi:hypothetical protein
MGKHFTIGEDDDLHHFLSLKITWDLENRLVYLCQSHHIKELRERFCPDHYFRVATPSSSAFKDLRRRVPNEQTSLHCKKICFNCHQ